MSRQLLACPHCDGDIPGVPSQVPARVTLQLRASSDQILSLSQRSHRKASESCLREERVPSLSATRPSHMNISSSLSYSYPHSQSLSLPPVSHRLRTPFNPQPECGRLPPAPTSTGPPEQWWFPCSSLSSLVLVCMCGKQSQHAAVVGAHEWPPHCFLKAGNWWFLYFSRVFWRTARQEKGLRHSGEEARVGENG